ncbi:MAG: class I SAM-dependent methyltransferase [Planctomycetota bacterium]
MDAFKYTTIAHRDRRLLMPVSDSAVDDLLQRVSDERHTEPATSLRALDVGCGKGEVLIRAAALLGATGIGVDQNASFIAEARAAAAKRLPKDAVEFHGCRFEEFAFDDTPISFVICTGASHVFGDFPTALTRVAARLDARGWALFGEGFWQQPSAADYLASFGGSADEMVSLPATLERAQAAGFRVIAHRVSSPADWNAYETSYFESMQRWLADNPTDPDAPAFRAKSKNWFSAYQRWGHQTMGFVIMLLRKR